MKTNEENRFQYSERGEFNSAIWEIKKNLFNCSRYIINFLILFVGIILYFIFQDELAKLIYVREAYFAIIIILAFTVRIAFEWERVPILRFGRYIFTKGPGLFFIIPFVDKIVKYVDTRIRVTDFSAERVLTCDSVPVFVDAIIFWMIWDAQKATMEVENYKQAIALSAKTALRDIIGKNTLSRILSDRTGIGRQLQGILDKKTNPWGITSLSVEIKDIVIPTALEDAMSKEAQAEREKNARIILSRAEFEISTNFVEASEKYQNNNTALELRALNLLMEALNKNGSMIIVPSDVASMMNIGAVSGIAKQIYEKGGNKNGSS